MPRIQLDLPEECLRQLMTIAAAERRPMRSQAELLLIRSVADYITPLLHPIVFDQEMISEGERRPSARQR